MDNLGDVFALGLAYPNILKVVKAVVLENKITLSPTFVQATCKIELN